MIYYFLQHFYNKLFVRMKIRTPKIGSLKEKNNMTHNPVSGATTFKIPKIQTFRVLKIFGIYMVAILCPKYAQQYPFFLK